MSLLPLEATKPSPIGPCIKKLTSGQFVAKLVLPYATFQIVQMKGAKRTADSGWRLRNHVE